MGSRTLTGLALLALLGGCGDAAIGGGGGVPCSSSKECNEAVCDPATSTCVECLADSDCLSTSLFCAGKTCRVVVPCQSDKECPGQLCDTTFGRCVDCFDNSHCAPSAPFCVLHVCSSVAGGYSGGIDAGFVMPDAGGDTGAVVDVVEPGDTGGYVKPPVDAGPTDVALPDTGPVDAGGKPDTGSPDAGKPADTGTEPDIVIPETCGSADECDDLDPCTKQACTGGKCMFAIAAGNPCDDGDSCTSQDVCDKEGGCSGKPKVCDDGSICTDDSCNEVTGDCEFLPLNLLACDDGNSCTDNDTCMEGQCKGEGQDCEDDNPCTKDGCDGQGGCTHTAINNGKPCNDDNLCTEEDYCKDGGCVGKSSKCDDGNPCNIDSCDAIGKCTHSPVSGPCDDGDLCTENDFCKFGECKGDTADCSDNNQCTIDSCDLELGCQYKPISGIFCNDGNECTDGDICQQGVCVGEGADCDDGKPCTEDGCNASGICTHKALTTPPGDPFCDDGKPCTQGDHCEQGVCTGVPLECKADGDLCTSDYCNAKTGKCDYPFVAGSCDDGNMCTQFDACSNSGGVAMCVGQPKNCFNCCWGKNDASWDCKAGKCVEPSP